MEKEKQNLRPQAIHECCLDLGRNSGFGLFIFRLVSSNPTYKVLSNRIIDRYGPLTRDFDRIGERYKI